jgi:hypothetical protein
MSSSVQSTDAHSTIAFGHERRLAASVGGGILSAWTGQSDRARTEEGSGVMSPTQMIRADAFGLVPSILIVLMLILAMLGVVAHAAAL